MKFLKQIIPLILIASLAGCSRHPDGEASRHADHGEAGAPEQHAHGRGVTFSAKRGLSVPAHTAEFIGLKVEDVAERVVMSEFRFSAQVQRPVTAPRLASATGMASTVALASAEVAEGDAIHAQAGKAVSAQPDGGAALAGRIVDVETHKDRAVEHVDVTVAIEDPEGRLAAGTFLTVKTEIGSKKPVLCAPRSALIQTAEGQFVYTASGEHFVRTAVKTGVANDDYAEITDGLYPGDRVVTNAAKALWLAELESLRAGKSCADGH